MWCDLTILMNNFINIGPIVLLIRNQVHAFGLSTNLSKLPRRPNPSEVTIETPNTSL